MTIVKLDAQGVAQAAERLRAGQAVVLPLALPLPYAVAATSAAAVNEAKGRPAAQPAGVLVTASGEDWLPHVALEPHDAALALQLCRVELVNTLLPVRPDAPTWILDAAEAGHLGVTTGWLAQTRALEEEFGHLFVSSANATGDRAVVRASEAEAVFGRLLVLDGDSARGEGEAAGSATIVRFDTDGSCVVVRSGVHDRTFRDPASWLREARARCRARERG